MSQADPPRAAYRRSRQVMLALIVITFVVARGAVWNAMVPIQQTPDEPEHFGYVEQLSHQHAPWLHVDPVTGYNRWSVALEKSLTKSQSNRFAQQPFAQADWDPRQVAEDTRQLGGLADDRSRQLSDIPLRTTGIPPLHYLALSIPQRVFDNGNYLRALWLPRAFVTLVAAFGTLLAMMFVKRLLPDGLDRAFALAPLLLLPSVGFFAVNLNSDVSLLAAFSGISVLLLQVRRVPIGLRWMVIAGLVAVAALYTKQSGAVVVPAILLAIAIDGRRRRLPKRYKLGRLAAWLVTVTAAISPQYFVKGASATSFLNGASSNQAVSARTWFVERLPDRLETINRGFWGVFGQTDTVASVGAQRIGAILGGLFVTAACAALIKKIWHRRRATSRNDSGGGLLPVIVLPVLYAALLMGTDAQHIIIGLEPLGFAQGRHLMPILPHMAALFAVGVSTLLPWRAGRALVLGVWIAALTAMHVDALARTEVLRYYL